MKLRQESCISYCTSRSSPNSSFMMESSSRVAVAGLIGSVGPRFGGLLVKKGQKNNSAHFDIKLPFTCAHKPIQIKQIWIKPRDCIKCVESQAVNCHLPELNDVIGVCAKKRIMKYITFHTYKHCWQMAALFLSDLMLESVINGHL